MTLIPFLSMQTTTTSSELGVGGSFFKWAQDQDLYKLYDLFSLCNLAKDWGAAERGLGDGNVNYYLVSWWGVGTLQRGPVI